MPHPKTHIRWEEILERKEPSVLPFLRFYREVGLVPERAASEVDGASRAGRDPSRSTGPTSDR